MYKHILVAVAIDAMNSSEQSLQAAKLLAGKDGRVTLLHVREEIPGYASPYIPEGFDAEQKELAHKHLEALADQLENATAVVVTGHAGRSIIDWADNNKVDCIIVASHRPGLQDYFLGSTAARVVRHAQCAVHILR